MKSIQFNDRFHGDGFPALNCGRNAAANVWHHAVHTPAAGSVLAGADAGQMAVRADSAAVAVEVRDAAKALH